jgi:hypothetical protein
MKIRYIMRAKIAIRNNGVKCEDQDLDLASKSLDRNSVPSQIKANG